MTHPDNTPATPADETLPAFLDRAQNGVEPANKPKDAAEATVASTDAPKAEPTPDRKPSRKERRAAKAAAKSGKQAAKAKPAHRPSQIERTEDNPARSIVPSRFKAKYAEHDDSNGDEVAYAVKAFITVTNADGRPSLSVAKIKELAEANGIDFGKYDGLNLGQQSMNVRNRLRGILKSGKSITVGKRKFADAAKALRVRPTEVKEEAAGAEA